VPQIRQCSALLLQSGAPTSPAAAQLDAGGFAEKKAKCNAFTYYPREKRCCLHDRSRTDYTVDRMKGVYHVLRTTRVVDPCIQRERAEASSAMVQEAKTMIGACVLRLCRRMAVLRSTTHHPPESVQGTSRRAAWSAAGRSFTCT